MSRNQPNFLLLRMLRSAITIFVLGFCTLLSPVVFGQAVTITQVDAGPYTPGSSIAVRISIDPTVCLDKSNVFTLQLSDASGSFASPKNIGTSAGAGNGSYALFINGTLPVAANLPAGTGYKLRVITSNVATVGVPSSAITVTPGAAVTAGTATTPVLATTPETVFGNCTGSAPAFFNFSNTSVNDVASTVAFYDGASTSPDQLAPLITGSTVPLAATNISTYTVWVTSQGAASVATKAYLLLNNKTKTNFGASAQGPVCLTTIGGVSSATAQFFTDITTANGLQNNFPGMLYTITWGDGFTNTYTFCDIKNANGLFNHTYSQSSCGKANNAYVISFAATSTYCTNIAQPITASQPVLAPPTNSLTGPTNVCTGTPATFKNTSYAGQSVNGVGATCADNTATYSWLVDGSVKATGQSATSTFNWTFTTNGTHHVAIHYERTNDPSCTPSDAVLTICVQNAPVAGFTVPSNTYCAPANGIQITNTSTIDASCNAAYTYKYTITSPNGYSGTFTVPSPLVSFNNPGDYTVTLQITPPAGLAICPSAPFVSHIYVNGTPAPQLSGDYVICGNNKTLTFDPTAGPTQTTFPGAFQNITYLWTITAPAGAGAATFKNGTSASSQYPVINFPDYGTYVVTVTQTNACGGSASASQNIIQQIAPSVDAGPDVAICAGTTATLTGTITNDGSLVSTAWSGGSGTFSKTDTRNAATSTTTSVYTYTPTQAEIQAGHVTLTLTATTNLPGACQTVSDNAILTINPVSQVNSAAAVNLCNGAPLNYQITSSPAAGATYSWTATPDGNVTNLAQTSGTSNTISEPNVGNSSLTSPAVITYHITPTTAAGCIGNIFTLTVSIAPQPTISVTPSSVQICSNQPTGITMSSNIPATTYTWNAQVSAGATITGITRPLTPTSTAAIPDVLINTGTAAATVTYTITAYANGCTSVSAPVVVTVEPQINITSAPASPASICSGSPAGITVNSNLSNTQYVWSATTSNNGTVSGFNNGTSTSSTLNINDVLINNGTTVETVTYTITTTANSCPGVTVTKVLNVAPQQTINVTPTIAIICSGQSSGIALSSNISTAKYTWLAVPSAGSNITGYSQANSPVTASGISDALVNNGPDPATVTYTITGYANGCNTASQTSTITVNPALNVTKTNPTSVCNNTAASIILSSAVTGIKYTWTVATTGTATGANAQPTPTANGQINDVLLNNGTAVGTVTYTVTAHANNCDGQPIVITISVAPQQTISTTSPTSPICSNLPAGITITSNLPGATYTWTVTVSAGGNITGANPQSVPTMSGVINDILVNNGNATATVTYTITGHGNNCNTPSTQVTITVQPKLAVAVTAPASICSSQFSAIQITSAVNGITYTWTASSADPNLTGYSNNSTAIATTQIQDRLSNIGTAVASVTYTITAHANGCDNQLSPVTIIVAPLPTITATPAAAAICSGQPSNIAITSNLTTTKYTWTVSSTSASITGYSAQSTPITLNAPSQIQQTLVNAGTAPGSVTYNISAINSATTNNCAGNTVSVTITVQPAPVTANAGPDANVCGVTTYQLNGNNLGPSGGGMWALTSGQSGVTFNDPTVPNPTASGLVPGQSYTFRYTSKGLAPCNDTFDDVIINDR